MLSALERLVLSYVAATRPWHLALGLEIVPIYIYITVSTAVSKLLGFSELEAIASLH